MSHLSRRVLRPLFVAVAAVALLAVAAPASAHGIRSVVYADLSSGGPGVVHAQLQLEYDLLVVSAADAAKDDALFRDGTEAFEVRDADEQAAALRAHRDDVSAYVAERFRISGAGSCTPTPADDITMTQQEGVPYAVLDLDYACPPSENGHEVVSSLFPTMRATSPTPRRSSPTRSTCTRAARCWMPSTVVHDGAVAARALLGVLPPRRRAPAHGIDHILFLLALIVGSRRLREVVIAATTFTVAHSVTFILAATGVVAARRDRRADHRLSIAVVGAWYSASLARGQGRPGPVARPRLPAPRSRGVAARVGVVFLFGLVHGLGFASALGIDEPWSWTLLWSLLVFTSASRRCRSA